MMHGQPNIKILHYGFVGVAAQWKCARIGNMPSNQKGKGRRQS
jgi:hypothetical protein